MLRPSIKSRLKGVYFFLLPVVCLITLYLAKPLRLLRRRVYKQVNSLWAGTPILTLPIKAKAERLLGVSAKSLVFGTYGIAEHGFDVNLHRFARIPILGIFVYWAVFFYAAVFQDRLHFFCDQTLLPSNGRCLNQCELDVYRNLDIKMFFWVYGGDVRTRQKTKELGEPNCCSFCPSVGLACICDEEKGCRNYAMISRYATAVFSMGDMIHYTPGSRNDVFFWPIDLSANQGEKFKPHYPEMTTHKALRIVHAANHRHFKGTNFLIEAVEELRAEGLDIDLILVEGLPNDQAVAEYRKADVIFEQCLIGFHGYFALEGMALGKPVMCFIRKPELYLLSPEECPIILTSVSTLKQDICRLFECREKLKEIGCKSRQYIERHYTVEAFAQRLERVYRQIGVMA